MKEIQTGDYCEVTETQATELLKIEGVSTPKAYTDLFFELRKFPVVYIRYEKDFSLILSELKYERHVNEMTFVEFKEQLLKKLNNEQSGN